MRSFILLILYSRDTKNKKKGPAGRILSLLWPFLPGLLLRQCSEGTCPSLSSSGLWYSSITHTALRSLHFPYPFQLCFRYRPLLALPQLQPDFCFILSRSHTTCFGLSAPLLAQAHVCSSLVLYSVGSSPPAARCLLPDAPAQTYLSSSVLPKTRFRESLPAQRGAEHAE